MDVFSMSAIPIEQRMKIKQRIFSQQLINALDIEGAFTVNNLNERKTSKECHLIAFPFGASIKSIESFSVESLCIYYKKSILSSKKVRWGNRR